MLGKGVLEKVTKTSTIIWNSLEKTNELITKRNGDRLFSFVDTENLSSILNLMTEDCSFNVETHGITLQGFDEIRIMFERLWDNHEWVKHDQFEWVEGRLDQDIAVRFRVTNKLHDGTLVNKSNCNFFTLRNGLFSTVRVYMAGANTLNVKD